jgi:hypothetical protein
MAGTGGARPGAGRKRKTQKFETQIQKAESMIADRLPWLVDKAMELADGVAVEKYNSMGVPQVYQLPPDMTAIKYLVDRIMGKPTERRELALEKPLEEMTEDELRSILES